PPPRRGGAPKAPRPAPARGRRGGGPRAGRGAGAARAARRSRRRRDRAGTRRQGDDLHRRLLQRPRARGRSRRHHPRLERRRARGVRRADAPRLRSAPRFPVRRRLEPGSGGAVDHPEAGAEPRAAAAAAAAAQGGGMTEQRATRGLIPWTLAALRPFRRSVVLLAVLLVAEIGLGALQPWPLAIVINLLSGQPMPELVAPVISRIPAGHTFALLIVIV